MAWRRMRGPKLGTGPESVNAHKGTMLDTFARCLEKEEDSPGTYIDQIVYNSPRGFIANTIFVVTLSVDQHPRSKSITL
jgi:hypothetical protein